MSEFLKEIVISVYKAGMSNTVYYLFHIAAFVSVFIMAQWLGRKVNVSRLKSFLLVLIIYPLMYLWMLLYFWIESGFTYFGGQHIVCIFVYAPLLAIPVAKMLKIGLKEMCFIIAPLFPLNHMVGHLGCFFAGCCRGYESVNGQGFYHPAENIFYFPIQPIESAVALAIVIVLVLVAKKKNYYPDPIFYPLMLVMFGSTRFVLEFFRDNDKILWGCSSLSFHALFMALVGAVAIIVIKTKKRNA